MFDKIIVPLSIACIVIACALFTTKSILGIIGVPLLIFGILNPIVSDGKKW